MQSHTLLLLVDVAGLHKPEDITPRILLVARILAACQTEGNLLWRYKLVNLVVTATAFEAALHDTCKSAGKPLLYHPSLQC